jgi:hypothetical protein
MSAQATVFPAHRLGEQRSVSNSRFGVHHHAENRDTFAVPLRIEDHADRSIGQEFHAAQPVDIDIRYFHRLHECSDRLGRHDKVAHDDPLTPAGCCCLFVRRQTSALHRSLQVSMDFGPISYNYFSSRNLQRNSTPSAPSGVDSRPSRRLTLSVGTFPSPSALLCPPGVSAEQPAEVHPSPSAGSSISSPLRFTPVFAAGNSGGSAAHHTRASRRLSIVVRRYVCRYVNLSGHLDRGSFGSLRQSLQKPRSGLSKRLTVLCCTVFHADQSSMEAIAACAKSSSKGCIK